MVICVLLGICLAGCSASQHVSKPPASKPTTSTGRTAPKVSRKTWHIAGFVVKEMPLPANYKANENGELVLGTTILKMGSKPPYPVTWQSLTSTAAGTVLSAGCPPNTLFAYADQNNGYGSGYAGFICVGRERSQLTLVHVPSMKVSTYPMPGSPTGAFFMNALAFDSTSGPQILWSVQQSEMAAPLLGSGILNLASGTESPIPAAMNTALFVSPNGTLFAVNGQSLSKWNGKSFLPLGKIPYVRVQTVADNGAVWADQPSPSDVLEDSIIREMPGSTNTQAWKVDGSNMFIGPGFVTYTPGKSLYGPVNIFFPGVDRTLPIDNVYGQPLLEGFQRANDQILITTSVPPVVIEIIPPS